MKIIAEIFVYVNKNAYLCSVNQTKTTIMKTIWNLLLVILTLVLVVEVGYVMLTREFDEDEIYLNAMVEDGWTIEE